MSTEQQIVKRNGGGALVAREEFGVTQTEVVRETASTAVAAREKAAVEARYIMAMRNPRNVEQARQDLLKACANPDFAEAAWFDLTQHNKGEGFTIRFAEEAIRAFGNVYPEASIVYESDEIRMVRVTVTDLQANVPYSSEIIIKKQVERSTLKRDQVAISERINSQGKKVYLVEATDDEVTSRLNNMKSKAIRTDGLRLIPAWLKAECKRAIFATGEGQVKNDPDAARRKVIDGFAGLGIKVSNLEEYLGHTVETFSPKELVHLRQLYVAVSNNEISWAEALEARDSALEGQQQTGSKQAAKAVLEEKLKKAAAQTGGPQPGTPEFNAELDKQIAAEEAARDTKAAESKSQRGFFPGGAKK